MPPRRRSFSIELPVAPGCTSVHPINNDGGSLLIGSNPRAINTLDTRGKRLLITTRTLAALGFKISHIERQRTTFTQLTRQRVHALVTFCVGNPGHPNQVNLHLLPLGPAYHQGFNVLHPDGSFEDTASGTLMGFFDVDQVTLDSLTSIRPGYFKIEPL